MRPAPASFLRAATGLSVLAAVAASAAFLREIVQAASFGGGAAVDAYLVAVAVPVMINTSVVSTLESAFVPTYLASKAEGGRHRVVALAADTQAWLIGTSVLVVSLILAALPWLAPFQAPGFPRDEIRLVQRLAVWTTPSIVFAGLYGLGRSVLNAERRFFFPAFAQAVGAAVMIAVMILGRRTMGITALAAGYTAGTMALWLTVYIPILTAGLPGAGVRVSRPSPDLRRLMRLIAPVIGGVVAMSAIAVVDRLMASRFPPGAISALGYADRVVQVPLTLIVTAVTTAAFPVLAQRAVAGDLPGLKHVLRTSTLLIAIILTPLVIVVMVRADDVVSVLFERGAFTAADAQLTSLALVGFACGLVFMGIFQMVPRAFNALHLGSFIALSGVVSLAFKILFNVLFVSAWGFIGFSLATSAMYCAAGVVMAGLLRHRIRGLGLRAILPGLGAALVGGMAAVVVILLLGPRVRGWAPVARLAVLSSAALAVYAPTVWVVSGRPSRLSSWLQPEGEDARDAL